MRITNKMMSNNSLSNINSNKEYLDKLNTQMSTEKKINRPSDDPIVAIRALRLRSSLSEVTQYYGANVPDAQSWVSVTESAIDSTKEILTSMKSYCNQGANGTNTTSDRAKILENLKALQEQIYTNGNTNYAGRSVFTGYRTGEKLTFTEDTSCKYTGIKDLFNASDVTTATYVEGAVSMSDITALTTADNGETTVKNDTVNRIRLSYDELAASTSTDAVVTYRTPLSTSPVSTGTTGTSTGRLTNVVITDGATTHTLALTWDSAAEKYTTTNGDGTLTTHTDGSITFTTTASGTPPTSTVYNISSDGKTIQSAYSESSLTVKVCNSTDAVSGTDTAYQRVAVNESGTSANTGEVYLLKDTGELVFSSDVAKTLSSLKDITGVDTISVTYDKTDFNNGDLRPEHYFDCVSTDSAGTSVTYDSHDQAIYYTVGTNQNIKINTNADDVFDTQISREVDDIVNQINAVDAAQEKVDKLKSMQSDTTTYGTDDQTKITTLLDSANKELTLEKNKLQTLYENGITSFGSFFDQANQAETACGTVDNRLELISNRLQKEKTTVTTLTSENENVDITNIAVDVQEAELVYNAALLATGKISQQSLINYI